MNSFKKYSQSTAFVVEGKIFSYEAVGRRVSGILNILSTCEGERIGVLSDNSIDTYAAILAVMIYGKAYVILHPFYPEERNQKIVRKAGISTVLGYHIHESRCHIPSGVRLVDTATVADMPTGHIRCRATADDIAYIIFTSGSTGEPKGVPISHRNLNAFYHAYSALGWQLDEHDRMLQMFEPTFDVSVVSMLFPLTIGASVYTVGYGEMKHFRVFELMESCRLTFAAVTPSLLQLLAQYADEMYLPDIKYLILTAEASQCDLVDHFRPVFPNAEFINLYGPTEATIYCSSYRIPALPLCKQHNGMVAIGKPFAGIHVMVADSGGNPVPAGCEGELWVSGAQVMSGYLGDEKRSRQAFAECGGRLYYRTGDVCILDADGDLIYCGRKDHQVKIRGFRIELNEIEYAANRFYSNGCNAVALPVNEQGVCSKLFLAVEGKADDTKGLMAYLRHNLPGYMVPDSLFFIQQFPVTGSNKIDRNKISELIIKDRLQ